MDSKYQRSPAHDNPELPGLPAPDQNAASAPRQGDTTAHAQASRDAALAKKQPQPEAIPEGGSGKEMDTAGHHSNTSGHQNPAEDVKQAQQETPLSDIPTQGAAGSKPKTEENQKLQERDKPVKEDPATAEMPNGTAADSKPKTEEHQNLPEHDKPVKHEPATSEGPNDTAADSVVKQETSTSELPNDKATDSTPKADEHRNPAERDQATKQESAPIGASDGSSCQTGPNTEERQLAAEDAKIVKQELHSSDLANENGEHQVAAEKDAEKIWRQIHFYFSDSNLPRDSFLKAKTEEDPDGYVNLGLLCTFKRMQTLNATPQAVAEIFEQKRNDNPDPNWPVLELSEGKDRVRRTNEIPDQVADASKPRTVYAKGWDPGSEPSIESVQTLFEPFGRVLCVRLRRKPLPDNKNESFFKGSVFVEFSSVEEASAVVKTSISLPGSETKLKLLMLRDYVAEKQEKRKHFRQKTAKEGGKEDSKPGNGEENNIVRGLVVRVEGVGPGVAREDLRELMENYGTVEWIDYTREEADGCIRFATKESAAEAIAQLKEKRSELGGKVPEWSLLEGEAEDKYWKDISAAKQAARVRAQKRKRDSYTDRWKKKRDRPNGGAHGKKPEQKTDGGVADKEGREVVKQSPPNQPTTREPTNEVTQ